MLQDLQTKLKELDNILFINAGGCAIVAVAVVLFIKRRNLSADPKIHYTCWGSNKEAVRKNDYSLLNCSHAFVRYKDFFIDSNGVRTKKKTMSSWKEAEEIPFKLVRQDISDVSRWNDRFNRENIKTIDNIMGTNLQKNLQHENNC